nr:hypothetical protein [Pseudacidovorax sp. NFM-22]
MAPPFRGNVNRFISAIRAAGGTVRISATYRPKERAYLMHYAAAIARGIVAPDRVPSMAGVDIEWDHGANEASLAAAREMAAAYDIVYPPALLTRHTERAAIDMTISGLRNKTVKDASGADISIKTDSDLYEVGESYGVMKHRLDRPHWSDNGH